MKKYYSFDSILRDIKLLKIQGAQNVAFGGVLALKLFVKEKLTKQNINFKLKIEKAIKIISSTRSTEPMMRNMLNFIYINLDYNSLYSLKESFDKIESKLFEMLRSGEKKLIKYGSNKIFKNSIIYTHCHSSTVTKIIIKSKSKVKEVHNTETRPLYQGRITAKELAKNNIKVEHFVDSAFRLAIRDVDIILLGADAITVDGVFNKVGSEALALIAYYYNKPLYICSHSWKYDYFSEFGFDEKIEKRNAKEIWNVKNKNIKINNYAFEKIDNKLITGIISELGILPLSTFIEEFKKKYKF